MPSLLKDDRYGFELNRYDLLKLIALVSMVIDHVGQFYFPDNFWFRLFGRAAFPLFFFLIGYSRSTRIPHDLLLCAIGLAAIQAASFHPVFPLNILVSVIITRLGLRYYEQYPWLERNPLAVLMGLLILWGPLSMLIDYGTAGLMFALCGRFARQSPWKGEYLGFAIVSFLIHTITQSLSCHLDVYATVALTIMMGSMCWWLRRFEIKPLPVTSGILKLASRRSLEIYALHLAALYLSEAWLFPDRFTAFQCWMPLTATH